MSVSELIDRRGRYDLRSDECFGEPFDGSGFRRDSSIPYYDRDRLDERSFDDGYHVYFPEFGEAGSSITDISTCFDSPVNEVRDVVIRNEPGTKIYHDDAGHLVVDTNYDPSHGLVNGIEVNTDAGNGKYAHDTWKSTVDETTGFMSADGKDIVLTLSEKDKNNLVVKDSSGNCVRYFDGANNLVVDPVGKDKSANQIMAESDARAKARESNDFSVTDVQKAAVDAYNGKNIEVSKEAMDVATALRASAIMPEPLGSVSDASVGNIASARDILQNTSTQEIGARIDAMVSNGTYDAPGMTDMLTNFRGSVNELACDVCGNANAEVKGNPSLVPDHDRFIEQLVGEETSPNAATKSDETAKNGSEMNVSDDPFIQQVVGQAASDNVDFSSDIMAGANDASNAVVQAVENVPEPVIEPEPVVEAAVEPVLSA